jgi:uncharacterized Fe-S cluster-containing radical SAM superfamily protein
MHNKQILDDIVELYHVIGRPFFIGNYTQSVINTLYNHLKDNRRDAYSSNQRIIIVQDCNDVYDSYGENLGQTIAYLQKFLTELDITNCFVHVISGNKNIAEELLQAQKLFSKDTTNIEYSIVDLPFTKSVTKRDSFCGRAWTHLFVDTHAKLRLCCLTDDKSVLGNIRQEDIYDVYNNENFRTARRKMINGELIEACRACYEIEDAGLESQRQSYNKNWKDVIAKSLANTKADGTIINLEYVEAQIAMNNVCNLMCRTCSGVSSSKLAREEKKLFGYNDNLDAMVTKNEMKDVVENIKKSCAHVQKLKFAGGEPLIQDEHYEILHHLLRTANNSAKLQYNTNGTTIKHKDNDICALWNKFENVRVNFSLDGIGSAFNYIRHGADWHTVAQNFITIKTQCPAIDLRVSSVISFLSLESIIKLQKEWHNSKILDISKFEIEIMLKNNDFYNVQTLPLHHKNRFAKLIDEHCIWLGNQNNSLTEDWQSVKEYMFAKDLQYVLKSLQTDISLRDKHRNTNFAKVYPQFLDIFNDL